MPPHTAMNHHGYSATTHGPHARQLPHTAPTPVSRRSGGLERLGTDAIENLRSSAKHESIRAGRANPDAREDWLGSITGRSSAREHQAQRKCGVTRARHDRQSRLQGGRARRRSPDLAEGATAAPRRVPGDLRSRPVRGQETRAQRRSVDLPLPASLSHSRTSLPVHGRRQDAGGAFTHDAGVDRAAFDQGLSHFLA